MNNIFRSIRPALMSFIALFVAMIATTLVHVAFGFVLEPFPEKALMEAAAEDKAAVMQQYMTLEPMAIYSALLAHGLGGFVGVFFVLVANRTWDEKRGILRPQWISPLIVGLFWIYADISNDINDAPIGLGWTAVDVLVTLAFTIGGFFLGNYTVNRSKTV